jgi:hypothetical protein
MEKNFEDYFVSINPYHEFLVSRMRCAMDVEQVTFDDISTLNMIKFKRYMADEVHNNSLKTYMAIIASTINKLAADGLCRRVDFKSINHIKSI